MPNDAKTIKVIGRVVSIPVDKLDSSHFSFRTTFSDDGICALSESVKNIGVIEPLTVRMNGENYQIISGTRRLKAALDAHLSSVPCIIVHTDDCAAAVMSLAENIERENLHFFDEAKGIEALIYNYGLQRNMVSAYLGISLPSLCNKLRLLNLSEEVRKIIIENSLTERHARALLRLRTGEERVRFARIIAEKSLTVSASEALIYKHLNNAQAGKNVFIPKDVKLFINTLSGALNSMRKAGIAADSQRRETEDFFEFLIRIPKHSE